MQLVQQLGCENGRQGTSVYKSLIDSPQAPIVTKYINLFAGAQLDDLV